MMSVSTIGRFLPATAALVVAASLATSSVARADSLSLSISNPGAINDGGNADGTAPSVTRYFFTDANQTGTIIGTPSITITGSHTYVGDLEARLRFVPDDLSQPFIDVPLFVEISDDALTLSNNLEGSYTFSNLATQTLQDAANPDNDNATVPSGTYLPSDFYFEGQPPAVVDLATAFNGQSLANGSFQLLLQDYYQGDTGSITSATLNLTTAVPEPASISALLGAGLTMLARRRR